MVDNITFFWAMTLTGMSFFVLAIAIFYYASTRQPKK